MRGCTLRDVAEILAITRASDIAALGEPDWSEDEIVETLTAPNQDPALDSWLAFAPAAPAAAPAPAPAAGGSAFATSPIPAASFSSPTPAAPTASRPAAPVAPAFFSSRETGGFTAPSGAAPVPTSAPPAAAAATPGEAVAWAYVDNPQRGTRDNVEVYATPGRGAPAYGPLLDLAVTRVAERAREAGHAEVTLRAGALASETAYIAVLRERGFAFRKRHARMRRVLTGAERLPEDAGIRPVRAGDEAEMRRFQEVLETAFADTPDFQPTSYADWRAALDRLPSISWDEWFVAERSGRIVGVLQSADQAVEHNEGWIKNLAVLREHRKGGLGGALLRTAFATYAAKGRTAAGLGVDLTNPTGAYQLYTGVGMSVTFAADVYERQVMASRS